MQIDLLDENETNVYTYEVKLTISIVANSLENATEKLNKDGGYINRREITLLDSTNVYATEVASKKSSKKTK
jgi:hypothetical protein